MGRRTRSKADSIKFNTEKQKRFYNHYHPDRSANPLPVSTLASTSNNLPASSLPANIQVSQPSTSQQATTSKLPTLPQTTLSIPIKQDDYLHPIQNPITSIESNTKLANTPQLALTNDANALSINVQSFPIRPRNTPSPPKKQQRPTRESAHLPDQDDIFDNYNTGYEGNTDNTENEKSRESGFQGKAKATKRRSPHAQYARSLPSTPHQRIIIATPGTPRRTQRRSTRSSSLESTKSPSKLLLSPRAPVSQGRRLPSEQLPSRSAFRTEQSDSDSTYHGVPTSLTQANDMDTESDERQESNTTDSEGEHQLQLQAQIQAELQQADNPQIDCVSSLARHLFAFQGYTIEEHTETDNRENPNHSSEDHLTLEGLIDFFDRQHRPPIFDEDNLVQSRQVYKDTHPLLNFQALFTGISVNSLKVCLLCSQMPRYNGHIQWDFDSFLGFAPSLDFAKQGLLLNTYPRFQQNISRSVHLFSNITDTSNPTRLKVIKVPLHNVPHYYFGKIIGRKDISVYIFFPQIWAREKATNFPGSDNGEPSSILRNCNTSTENVHKKALSLHYAIQARDLTAIWLDILGQLPLPGNELYRDTFIFFANMNTKLNFKDNSPGVSWATFNLSMSSAINFDNLDRARIYADLGKETAATDWDPSRGETGNDSLPTTYLIRTCYQKSFVQWADLGEPGKSVKAHFYMSTILRDITDMTLNISRYCYKRNQGWIYSQTYNSFKEIYDAAKCKPFGSKFLQQLARNPEIDKIIRAKGKGSAIAREKIWKMYFDCRYRFANACSQAAPYSFGVREEHRLSFTFIDRLEERLRTTGEWDQKRDLIYTANLGGRIPYEQCKVMIMLLQALPYTFNTGPDKQRDRTALWQTKFQRNRASEKQLLGIGIKDAINYCGYDWILDRIDWERLAFRPEIAAEIAYTDNAIRDKYHKNWKEIVQSKGNYTRIEATSRWLELYHEDPTCLEYIKSFLLVNLIRIYRQEIFRFISHLVRPESQEQAKSGQIIFYRVSFQRTKTKLIQDLLFHMWGFTDEERKHWESLPFRALSKRACEILGEHCGAKARRQFHNIIGHYFITTHWLFPRPIHSKFVQRNHWNEMCWTEVYHRRFVHSAVAQNRIVNVSLLLPTTISKEGTNDESLIIIYREIDKWLTGFMQKNGRPWDPKLDEEPEIDRFGIPTPKRVLRRWRMVDWDFSVPGKREHMSQIPSDHVATLAPFDSELETITSALDMAWCVW
ncbi:hypothetical protein NA56DRAFT_652833 [Hyaloscypha hepaticicola]|uniref:Uncharacterized protein n=1 Tax=Hyaloscypha hepaticicola TaxID=2082293 RepID=A0A2J6PD43_9HELO|nr:hypothetical protein NA56DRAFT_652833 [Hyaloscypha hepaticicola]